MASRTEWEQSQKQLVLPVNANDPVPLDDYDDDPTEAVSEPDESTAEPTPAETFPCPYTGCDGVLSGEPDECPECEGELEWQ
ncbi:hypothetical protein DVK00_02860 [Haloarcula sp. Atlit-47R]|uniref:hypothetical protein n=1 Tax=Haloarcula sp. Atlit-47R TaxID=2282132 RepID=UPI000FF8279E|nr:hypothetical protein [Haloarcula sp. Atlit-47R]RLM47465.1 hypothetical protein DVK00_02860 [Haloarcula sp. Atlit-47R]